MEDLIRQHNCPTLPELVGLLLAFNQFAHYVSCVLRRCGNDICFADRSSPTAGHLIRFNTSKGSHHSTPVDLGPEIGPALGIDVSADGRWLVYTRADSTQSDVMVIENFH